jgi:GNAT superfamily N-acetyltransferase
MKVQVAEKQHIEQILDLGNIFFDSTLLAKAGAAFGREHTKALLERLQDAGLIVVAIAEEKVVGFILLDVTISLYTAEVLMGTELAFYVDPKYRKLGAGKFLIKEAERVLREKGVQVYSMAVLSTSNYEQVMQMYNELGFIHTESYFSKVL